MVDYKELSGKFGKVNMAKRVAVSKLFDDGDTRLYMGQLPVLEYVSAHNGCTQVELSEFLGVSPSSVAVSTKRMQKSGLLEKRDDENNLRCKNLWITETGEKILSYCRKIFDDFDKKFYHGISDYELEIFERVIDKMMSNIADDIDGKLCPEKLFEMNSEKPNNFKNRKIEEE